MRIKIFNKFWNLKFVPNLGSKLGDCSDPKKPNKEIRIWQGCNKEEELEVIIHEVLHASMWHLDEEFVDQFANDCARVLYRLGYRKHESNG